MNKTFSYLVKHPVAGKHLFRAFYRYLSWQLRSRLNKGMLTEPFVNNVTLTGKRGMAGVTGNIYAGLQEFEDMSFLLHFLRPGDLFYDVGANAGSFTVLAAGVCGSRCVSFEPVPETFIVLEKNVSENGIGPLVKCEHAAAGAVNGDLMITTGEDARNHVTAYEGAQSCRVPVLRLDDYASGDVPSFMKIDVEGYEQEVVNGAGKMLADERLQVILIELNGSGASFGYSDENIHRQLLAAGFLRCRYHPFTRSVDPSDVFGEFNTLYLKDVEKAVGRVKTAESFSSLGERI